MEEKRRSPRPTDESERGGMKRQRALRASGCIADTEANGRQMSSPSALSRSAEVDSFQGDPPSRNENAFAQPACGRQALLQVLMPGNYLTK